MWRVRISVLICCTLLFCGCGEQVENQSEALLFTDEIVQEELQTTQVQKKTYVQEAFANASVYYTKQSVIRLKAEDAELKTIEVKVGDRVRKGDLVATYKMNISKADLERERANIDNARLSYRASYTSLLNQINEQKRKVRNATSEEERLQQRNVLRQLREQQKLKINEEQRIIQREAALQNRINRASQTKLYSDYDGIVMDVMDLGFGDSSDMDYGYDSYGRDIVTLRTDDDFLIQIDRAGFSSDQVDLLRYNTEVTIALGSDRNDINHRMKGKVISAENLIDESLYSLYSDEGNENASKTMIQISDADRKKYSFKKTNIYVEYERLRVNDCLVVEKDAVYTELDGEEFRYYVYVVENGNIYKRYIVRALEGYDIQPEEWILQGVEEGQILAKNISAER
ncbi:MAG: hypothetical protein LBR68_02525 [Lachnoclostridium sp.]|jgi:multidrug efflux pump subunit AcrA (membrane-fusion protein)|nr:hypothetical protein [Lachnoclostridium sp.]